MGGPAVYHPILRYLSPQVEAILEAAWEALEMAVALHAQLEGHELQRSEAHGRPRA